MTRDEANKRLIRSRQVIYGWESMDYPIQRPEDIARMVHEEIAVLRAIIAEFPTKALTVGELIKRYEVMGEKARAKAN